MRQKIREELFVMREGTACSPIETTIEHVDVGSDVRDGAGDVMENVEGHGSRQLAGEDQ